MITMGNTLHIPTTFTQATPPTPAHVPMKRNTNLSELTSPKLIIQILNYPWLLI